MHHRQPLPTKDRWMMRLSMDKPTIFMFSGQGSQYYHMGKELYAQNPSFKQWMKSLDEIAKRIMGDSVLDELYSPENDMSFQFDHTRFSSTAIIMVEYAMAQVLFENGIEPDYVLGASLGEYTSAVIAGMMEIEWALEALARQVELFEARCLEGGMTAIVDDYRLLHDIPISYENSELAARNYDSHFVVSGKKEALTKIENHLERTDIIFQTLPVSYGFHSSYNLNSISIQAA
ncbi:MAG: acyltransferase domain-containing protein [Desulfobacterales bacterium]|nr:acyltransferase domain-containing protein [Desulfobacterales bacterium]